MHRLTAIAFALVMGSSGALAADPSSPSGAAAETEKPGQLSGQVGPAGSGTTADMASTSGMAHDDFDPMTLDMDKDGYVTQAEAQRMVDSGKMDFNAMDVDKDGRISVAEGKSFSATAPQSSQPGQAGQAGQPGETAPEGY